MIAAIFELNWGFIDGMVLGVLIAAPLVWLYLRRRNGKYSGTIVITKTADKKIFSLELDHAPEDLEKKKEATFKVKPPE